MEFDPTAQSIIPEGAGAMLNYKNITYLMVRNPDYVKNDKRRSELEYPGGKVENAEESYAKCAMREVFEETASTLILDPEQLREDKSVTSLSPAGKGVRLYIVELTDEQQAEMSKVAKAVREAYKKDKSKCEMMDVCEVPLDLLKAWLQGRPSGPLPNRLTLRAFNAILLRMALSQSLF